MLDLTFSLSLESLLVRSEYISSAWLPIYKSWWLGYAIWLPRNGSFAPLNTHYYLHPLLFYGVSVNGFSICVKDIQALEDTHAPVTIQFIALGREYL